MTADAFEILLLLRADGALLPVYRGALTQAQGWPWSIRRRYRGALLVARAGVARVAGIEVTGPVGDAVPARVFSVLNGDWRVAVRLEEAPMPFDAVRDAVMRSLRANDAAGRTPFDRPPRRNASPPWRAWTPSSGCSRRSVWTTRRSRRSTSSRHLRAAGRVSPRRAAAAGTRGSPGWARRGAASGAARGGRARRA